jgi:hypothetical protein
MTQRASVPRQTQSSQSTRRICTLSGIDATQKQIVQLNDLLKGLRASRAEIMQQYVLENLVNAGHVAAVFAKSGADIFFSFLALSPNKGLQAAAIAYRGATGTADALSRYSTGSRTLGQTGTAITGEVLKASLGLAGARAKPDTDVEKLAKHAGGTLGVTTDVVTGAVNQDQEAVVKAALFDMGAELASLSAQMVGRDKWSNAIGVAKDCVTAGLEMYKAVDGLRQSSKETDERLRQGAKLINKQIVQIEQSIERLKRSIDECLAEAGSAQPQFVELR